VVVKEIYQALEQVSRRRDGRDRGADVAVAQRVSRRLYCMQEGRITLHGLSSELTRERISRRISACDDAELRRYAGAGRAPGSLYELFALGQSLLFA